MGFFKLKSFKLKNLKLKILVCIAFFLFLLGIVWYFFGSYKKEGFEKGEGVIKSYEKNGGYVSILTVKDDQGGQRFTYLDGVVDGNTFYKGARVSYDLYGEKRATNITLISPPATTTTQAKPAATTTTPASTEVKTKSIAVNNKNTSTFMKNFL